MPGDAAAMHQVTQQAFTARRPLDPPAAALSDTVDDVVAALEPPDFGVVAEQDGSLVGSLLVRLDDSIATLRRVGVLPDNRRSGVADAMVHATLRALADAGVKRARLLARAELPDTIAWWRAHGFMPDYEVPHGYVMSAGLPAPLVVQTADDMHNLGVKLARLLLPGDVIIASGDLGAGKTVLAQGIGDGLGVTDRVISPTFVLARLHHVASGPGLVHVDAYRIASPAEFDDLDVQVGLPDAVTYVEWGEGLAGGLGETRLEIYIDVRADDARVVYLTPIGRRWREVEWDSL